MPATADITALPSMDDHKIGPGGETFGQLKARVRDARAAYTATPNAVTLDAYESATNLLRAAYVRVGLPYRAP